MIFDVERARAHFPALHRRTSRGTVPVFFDNPAGTQVPQQVIDAITGYFLTMNANSGGRFATSERNDAMVQRVREKMADFLGASRPEEIVFGQNMTTLNFALSRALGCDLRPGDEIVVTRMDHDANIAPWLRLADDRGLVVRWVDIRPGDATLDFDSLEAALTGRTRIVATVHASNAVGTINAVDRIAGMAHAANALHVVDAVQSAPHVPIDVQAIGCDFLLCSSYKFYGPHLGILWGRYDLLASLPAYKVRPAHDEPPHRWETGTLAFELIAGLGATLDYLASYGDDDPAEAPAATGEDSRAGRYKRAMRRLQAFERELVAHLLDVLERMPKVRIAGITDRARLHERVPTVVFTVDGYTSAQVAERLAREDIYVWDGDYYAMEIMKRLGHAIDGMVRVGLAHYNTHQEIDRLEAALRQL
ncbi:MAG: cysteine desulfurase-like protein [Chloroflexota bacterium]|nr:MAG: cysteine desulfurase-like protein [Chloroflexota bacterium]